MCHANLPAAYATLAADSAVVALEPEPKHACTYCKTHHNEPVRCPSCAAPNAE